MNAQLVLEHDQPVRHVIIKPRVTPLGLGLRNGVVDVLSGLIRGAPSTGNLWLWD